MSFRSSDLSLEVYSIRIESSGTALVFEDALQTFFLAFASNDVSSKKSANSQDSVNLYETVHVTKFPQNAHNLQTASYIPD
jgi:hypothetical protein